LSGDWLRYLSMGAGGGALAGVHLGLVYTLLANREQRYYRSMAMIASDAEVERVELAPAAALFRSLGDPARLMIVRRLAVGPARVTDLTAGLGLAQSTVSKHLACLRDCGLVASEPAGRASVFRLAQPALADMLVSAEAVLAATGNAVALCPIWGGDCCDGNKS
jgi:ArsR family transcriptional regulator, cadmium/lead-responsive transcriptional repressor